MSTTHQEEEHQLNGGQVNNTPLNGETTHHQTESGSLKEDSDFDKELFQSSINNPIILQNKLNNHSEGESLFSEQTKTQHENRKEDIQTDEPQQNASAANPEDNPKVLRYSDAIIQDITNQPEEKIEEFTEKESHNQESVETIEKKEEDTQNKENSETHQEQNDPKIEEVSNQEKVNEEVNGKANCNDNEKQQQQNKEIEAEGVLELQRFSQIFTVTNQIKEQARVYVQKKQYKEAIRHYEECLQVIHISNFKLGPNKAKYGNIIKEQAELTCMLLCNLSLCHFNEGEFEKSLEYADKCIIVDVNHLKASYRRALALKKLQRYEKAFEEIKTARLIAIGKNQVDENINKEYKIIKQLYIDEKGSLSKNNSSSNINASDSTTNRNLSSLRNSSSFQKAADFLDDNFPGSMKTTPFYMMCSSFTTYVVLRRFMNISLLSKPAVIGAPLLSLSIFGFLQGKSVWTKLICGGLIGLISSILYRFSDLFAPKALTF